MKIKGLVDVKRGSPAVPSSSCPGQVLICPLREVVQLFTSKTITQEIKKRKKKVTSIGVGTREAGVPGLQHERKPSRKQQAVK